LRARVLDQGVRFGLRHAVEFLRHFLADTQQWVFGVKQRLVHILFMCPFFFGPNQHNNPIKKTA